MPQSRQLSEGFEKWKQGAIDSIDIFGQLPNFMVLEKTKFNSLLGFLTTILIGGITAIYLATEIISMINKSTPAVVSTEFQVFDTSSYPLLNENFTLAVSVSTALGHSLIGNGVYYNITINQCTRTRILGENGASSVTIECNNLPVETCNLSHFTTDVQIQYFSKMKFGAMQCINREFLKKNPPVNFCDIQILQGQLNAILYSYVEIFIKPCVNSSEIQTCAPQEKINEILMSAHYIAYTSDYLMQLSESKFPYKQIINNDLTSFSISSSKIIQSYYSIIETTSDDGLLFQSLNSATNLKLRDRKESSDFFNQHFLIDHYICLDYRSQQYSRTYIKIQAILSKIGGIWQIFIICVASFIKPFINYKMNLEIANKIFRFSKEANSQTQTAQEKFGPLPTDLRSTLSIIFGCNKNRRKSFEIGKQQITQNLDIVQILQKFQEIEVLKQILLSKEQLDLFQVLPKPIIETTFKRLKFTDTVQPALSYFKIIQKQQQTEVDERLLNLLEDKTNKLFQHQLISNSNLQSPKLIMSNNEDINEPIVCLPR